MTARKDPLAVLEAIQSFELDEASWMRGIVEAARPYDLGNGIGAYITSMGRQPVTRSVAIGADCAFEAAAVARSAASLAEYLPALYRYAHLPSTMRDSYEVVAEAKQVTGTSSERIAAALAVNEVFSSLPRSWGVIGGDARFETALVCFFSNGRRAPSRADRRAINLLGAHLGAALRLRALAGSPTPDAPATEAIFAPNGRVLDVRGDESERALPLLIDAIERSTQAKRRGSDRLEGLALWTAIVDGRWSIVETVERDGKRLVLACRNEPRTADIRRLTASERSVAEYAALGHSNKYIAYELGYSSSMVALVVKAVLRKLGLRSRAQLISVVASLGE